MSELSNRPSHIEVLKHYTSIILVTYNLFIFGSLCIAPSFLPLSSQHLNTVSVLEVIYSVTWLLLLANQWGYICLGYYLVSTDFSEDLLVFYSTHTSRSHRHQSQTACHLNNIASMSACQNQQETSYKDKVCFFYVVPFVDVYFYNIHVIVSQLLLCQCLN